MYLRYLEITYTERKKNEQEDRRLRDEKKNNTLLLFQVYNAKIGEKDFNLVDKV